MTTTEITAVPKLSKNERRLKREEATRLANQLLQFDGENKEVTMEKFSEIIGLLDNCKTGADELSSIFDLQILRSRKYTLHRMVSDYRKAKNE